MVTSTYFLYIAASKTPTIVTPTGKEVTLATLQEGTLSGICWLCGRKTKHGFSRSKVIKPTFTDSADYARESSSDVVCEYCTWALSMRELRNYSLLATEHGLRFPSRAELRDILLNPPPGPTLCTIAVSGQKWLHFKAHISPGGYPLRVRFEETEVLIPETFRFLLGDIEELYNGGFQKSEIETGRYLPHKIQQFGISRWDEIERRLISRRNSRLFEVAIFVAQREEDSAKCTTALKRQTKTLV